MDRARWFCPWGTRPGQRLRIGIEGREEALITHVSRTDSANKQLDNEGFEWGQGQEQVCTSEWRCPCSNRFPSSSQLRGLEKSQAICCPKLIYPLHSGSSPIAHQISREQSCLGAQKYVQTMQPSSLSWVLIPLHWTGLQKGQVRSKNLIPHKDSEQRKWLCNNL